MLCQTLCFLWHKVDVFLAQKCGYFSVCFSNLNIASFDLHPKSWTKQTNN